VKHKREEERIKNIREEEEEEEEEASL